MNYYEQFYDDLEFCEAEDNPYRCDEPYFHADPYFREDPHYHREWDRYSRPWVPGPHPEERRVPSTRRGGISHLIDHGNLRGHRQSRGHEPYRGRGRSSRGNGKNDNTDGRKFDRGRGNARGNQRGGLKTMNFVKASTSNTASSTDQTGKLETSESKGGNGSDQIRFDYKGYQNQPSASEREEEEALKAYTCHLGFGYGYGPRSDLIEGEQPEWLIGPEAENQVEVQETDNGLLQTETESTEKQESDMNVKKAMVSPAFNFVKAKSEFHSIDVAFHETGKEEKPKQNSLSVNFGNKRVGLGFGVSANKAVTQNVDISSAYYAGMKDGYNPNIDARFTRLQEAVKARSLPNKNAIEILHMAVDKVKMMISDEISASGRTPAGQPMFVCQLNIDGVSVALGQAMAKKAAKHEAYQNALTLFSKQTLTVKEISKGVFELRQKDAEFKVPLAVGPSTEKVTGQKPKYTPGQKSQPDSSSVGPAVSESVAQSAVAPESKTATTSQAGESSYSKPKIVFHQPSHPLNNKPLQFKDTQSVESQGPPASRPEALAMKLLSFVKEGAKYENESESNSMSSSLDDESKQMSATQNPRKRSKAQSQNVDKGRLKVQKKVDVVNRSIDDLSQFILIDNTPLNHTINELSILHTSANFNKVVLKLEYEQIPDGVRCSLILSDIIVAISHGPTKVDAKRQVACDSLNYLRECCYTIKIKQAVDTDSSGLTKEQLLSDIMKANEEGLGGVIPDTNIGNMLLRKMGWVGGGCGKDGTGIAEPVKADMIIGRQGLGLKAKEGKNFDQTVTRMLQDYIKSDEQKDLYFSSELTREERKVIHTIGQKLGLKTHSRGKDENRYLIVSRRRNAQQLLEHVWECGGSTSKYELIPPGDPDLDMMRREDISHGHCKQ